MSASVHAPVNRADTGPTRAAIDDPPCVVAVTRSSDSQPGTQALSTPGSLSAAQTVGRRRGHDARAGQSPSRCSLQCCPARSAQSRTRGRRSPRAGASSAAASSVEACEIVHRQEIVDVRQHRADARGARLEARVAQQRIQPDEPRARLREPLHLEREARAGVGVEAVADQQHDGVLRRAAAATSGG